MRRCALVLVATVLVVSACGGSSDGKSPGADQQVSREAPAPLPSALLQEPGSLVVAKVSLDGTLRWGVRPTPDFSVFSGMVIDGDSVYGQWASCRMGDAGLVAMDLTTGRQKWRTKALFGGETQSDGMLPSVLDSTYVALSGQDLEGATSRLVAVSTEDGSVRWKVDVPGSAMATVGGPVVAVADRDTASLKAYDRRTGKQLWSETVGQVVELASDRERVFVTTYEGETQSSAAYEARTGKTLWSLDGARLLGGSEISGGVVPAAKQPSPGQGGEELFVGLDAATGESRWKRPGLVDLGARLKQAAGRLALGTSLSGGISVLDPVTGKDLWTTADTDVVAVREHGVILYNGRLGVTANSLYDERGRRLGRPPSLAAEPDQVTPLPEVTSDHDVLLARGCPGRG